MKFGNECNLIFFELKLYFKNALTHVTVHWKKFYSVLNGQKSEYENLVEKSTSLYEFFKRRNGISQKYKSKRKDTKTQLWEGPSWWFSNYCLNYQQRYGTIYISRWKVPFLHISKKRSKIESSFRRQSYIGRRWINKC